MFHLPRQAPSPRAGGIEKRIREICDTQERYGYQSDGFLHTPIRILLKASADLHKADGHCDDEFAALGLLMPGRERTLA
ncbi:hypothetical protein LMTR13_25180 [Bradyrhizobium icense]|uniref:Uncharacterized protein n=1 Tax=Bradyrhizobium icense TaxID=1274631 RepID=A0A1B1UJW4_9BRAD|nr:hypothetical protein LMTR13_25180 [Bradyrhizobium icense]